MFIRYKVVLSFFLICIFSVLNKPQFVFAQEITGSHEIRWIRVGKLHSWFSSAGAEVEYGRRGRDLYERFDQADQLYWDAQYPNQKRCISKALWIGATNFENPVTGLTEPYHTVLSGPRHANTIESMMPFEFKMVGRFEMPRVEVDGVDASRNEPSSVPDEIDPALSADRMIINKLHSNMGITITRKILKFGQQNHDDYFIYDYLFKNTGIVDSEGSQINQTLSGVYFHFQFRYAPAYTAYLEGFNTNSGVVWGRNTVSQVIGQNPDNPTFQIRAFYSYYSPTSAAPSYASDWGAPNHAAGGALAAPALLGVVTLHADINPNDPTDDLLQPTSTPFTGADQEMLEQTSPYDTTFMDEQYLLMSAGHSQQTHAEAVGYMYGDQWGSDDGGYFQTLGFGPYTLNPGDSIHIAMAECVNGLSREKSIEIGNRWFNDEGPFELPNGTTTSDRDEYKKEWVDTAQDSLLLSFSKALDNYLADYQIPQPPPPPNEFYINSGTDRIHLIWSDNAELWPNFDGYNIYRAANRPDTLYEKIFTCDKDNAITQFDDLTAVPGIGYYYYIQSKDDGSTNDVHPGLPLTSDKFYTMSFIPTFVTNTGVDKFKVATSFRLEQNYPNPFNPTTSICFEIPKQSLVTIKIYDVAGREVITLAHEFKPSGQYHIEWHGQNASGTLVPSGVYFYHIKAERFEQTNKMLLMR